MAQNPGDQDEKQGIAQLAKELGAHLSKERQELAIQKQWAQHPPTDQTFKMRRSVGRPRGSRGSNNTDDSN